MNGISPVARHRARGPRASRCHASSGSAGYRTIHVGKAHFGALGTPGAGAAEPRLRRQHRGARGRRAGQLLSARTSATTPTGTRKGDRVWDVPGLDEIPRQAASSSPGAHPDGRWPSLDDAAASGDSPFFLYMSHYAVHTPIRRDPRFHQKYIDAGPRPGRSAVRAHGRVRRTRVLWRPDGMDHLPRTRASPGDTVVICSCPTTAG